MMKGPTKNYPRKKFNHKAAKTGSNKVKKHTPKLIKHITFLTKGRKGGPVVAGRILRGQFKQFFLFGVEDVDFRVDLRRRGKGPVRFYRNISTRNNTKKWVLIRTSWSGPFLFGGFAKGRPTFWSGARLGTVLHLRVTIEKESFQFSTLLRVR